MCPCRKKMVIFGPKCLTQTFCDALFFLGFTVSCYRAWWTAMRTRWTALGPAWCRGWAQRWPCLFSCCRTSPAHPLLWLQLPPSQLEWRAVGAGAGPWVPICTRSSLICETETLPVILAKSALPVTAPNFHSDSEKLHTLLKNIIKAPLFPRGDKIHSSARLEVTEICTSRECRNAHRVDIRVWLLLYCISYTLGLRETPLSIDCPLTVSVEHVARCICATQSSSLLFTSSNRDESLRCLLMPREKKRKKKTKKNKKTAIVVHASRAQV